MSRRARIVKGSAELTQLRAPDVRPREGDAERAHQWQQKTKDRGHCSCLRLRWVTINEYLDHMRDLGFEVCRIR
jgi:hypothetical protein